MATNTDPLPNVDRPRAGRSLGHATAALAILLLTIAAYGHTLDAPFVLDDVANIERNANVQMTSLDWSQLRAAAFDNRDNDRPLAYLSFALTHFAFGGDAAGYHIVNISIHVITGILVYLLTLLTFRRLHAIGQGVGGERLARWAALIGALVFVAHPIQTQAVTYTVQRMTSMATVFYLLALLLYVHGRLAHRRTIRWSLWFGTATAWVLALGTKQIAITLPLVIFLYEWYFFRDLSWSWFRRMLKLSVVPAVVLVILVGMIYVDADPLGRLERGYAARDFTMQERLLTQPRVIARYIGLILYPAPDQLNLSHSIETSRSLLQPVSTLSAFALVAALLALSVGIARRHRLVSFCLLWFFVHLAIESSFLALEMIYEHRLYLPMFGVSMLAASLWSSAALRWGTSLRRQASVAAVAGMAIVLFALAARTRNTVWVDPAVLWSDVIAKNRGDYPEAASQRARAYNNRGRVFGVRGQHRQAIDDFAEAIGLDPQDAEAQFNRGLALAADGQHRSAIADFSGAIELRGVHDQPFSAALLHRGRSHAQIGNYQAALADLEIAIEQSPRLADAYLSIAWIRATCPDEQYRDAPTALSIARAGCGATLWQSPRWLDSLACAYAAAGKFDAAVHWETKAIDLTPELLRANFLIRLRAFSEQQAYRDGVTSEPEAG